MEIEFTKKKRELENLLQKLNISPVPKSEEWGGADVGITSQKPKPWSGGFYSEPRYVVTPHAPELSWLFEQLQSVFSDLLDGTTKIELFGRLANAALRYQNKNTGDES